jgi:GT2 family glycosyltransferase/ubiquinone/menaquinone biosynthesis C-methylase UbiE
MTSAVTGQTLVEHLHRYLLAREFCRNRDVLDAACGEGYGSALLAQVARSVVGIDVDGASIDAAATEFSRGNLKFKKSDVRKIELPDNSVDVVVTFETIEHIAQQREFLSECRRVLRPDGLLIASTPDRDVYSPIGSPPNPYHVRELTRLEFETLVRQFFSNASFAQQRALIGSFIYSPESAEPLCCYESRNAQLIEGADHLQRAPYILAFASNAKLPPLPNSVYVYRSDLDTDMAVRREAELAKRAADERIAQLEEQISRSSTRFVDAQLHEALATRAAELEERFASMSMLLSDAAEREAEAAGRIAELRRTLELTQAAAAAVGLLEEQLVKNANQELCSAETISTLRQEMRVAEARIGQLESRLTAAHKEVQEGQQREAHARSVIDELQKSAEASAGRALNAEQRLDLNNLTIATKAREAEALARRLHVLETSTLWRATKPVRVMGTKFPGTSRIVRRAAKLAWWTATLQLSDRYRAWRKQSSPTSSVSAYAPPSPPPAQPRSQRSAFLRFPPSPHPKVSIVICTYGQVDLTIACLKSLAAHAPASPIEVIVINDAYEGPDDISRLENIHGITLIKNETNLGYLRSCNVGAAHARGQFLFLLNNDTEVLPASIDTLIEVMETRQDVGMVGSKLLFPDGRLQEAGGIIWADASGWNYGRGEDPSLPAFNYLRETDFCSGAALMIRRELFESLGGFDEAFAPAYYEDTDLAFRVRDRGFKVMYEPRSVVLHHEGMSHGTDINTGIKAHQAANQRVMRDKWSQKLAQHFANGLHVLRAADRGYHTKVLLVIDHYVPEPDRDAGSRSAMGILESFLAEGWIVKFWPHNRAYSPIYTAGLERLGIEVLDSRWPGSFDDWIKANGQELDYVLAIRPHIAAELLPSLRRETNAKLAFYGVDLHFARMKLQAEVSKDPQLLQDANSMLEIERQVWQTYDLSLYPSEEEAVMVQKLSPLTLVRGIVPFYFDTDPPRTGPPKEKTILFVAGFAHPPNVDAASFLVREIVPALEKEMGPVKVVLAGSNPTEAVRDLASKNVTVTGFISEEALSALYSTHRVAIVPLRFGAGVKGKVVQALSRGLPLVTTSIGAQGIIGLREVVPVHNDIPNIVTALVRLLKDDDAWMAQSSSQISFANRYFSRAAMQRSVVSAMQLLDAKEGHASIASARDQQSPATARLIARR